MTVIKWIIKFEDMSPKFVGFTIKINKKCKTFLTKDCDGLIKYILSVYDY